MVWRALGQGVRQILPRRLWWIVLQIVSRILREIVLGTLPEIAGRVADEEAV
jgi:hypothetical protein